MVSSTWDENLPSGNNAPSFLSTLNDALTSPMALGGLALLSGGGWDGYRGAVNSGLEMQKQQQILAQRKAVQNAVAGMTNLSPSDRQFFAASPDAASDFLGRMFAERYSPTFATNQTLRRAQIAEANAGVEKSRAEITALTRQNNLINQLMPQLLGTVPSPSQSGTLQPESPQPLVGSVPPEPAASAPGSGLPTSIMPPGISVTPLSPPANAGPSTSLPAPGDPTSFAGGSSAGMTTPSRLAPDTMRAAALDLVLNGGKGMSGIINSDPGSQYAKTFANKTAEDNASLNFKQKMTGPLLQQIQNMRQLATDAGSDVLSKATGPDYSEAYGFDTSGQPYQNMRAWGHWLDFPGRALGLDNAGSYDQAAKLNLQFQHLKKMIGAQVKALPGSKGGGASTDQDQALVLDAVGEALHSQDPETFFKILHDAENGLRARAGMELMQTPKSYLPDGWNSSGPTASATTGSSQNPVQVKTIQEALQLPKGTVFMTPDGRTKVVP